MSVTPRSGTVIETLSGLENCTRFGARFVSTSSEDRFYPYSDVVRRAQSAAGTLQSAGLRLGDRVAVILPTSIEFFDTFLGVQLAGGIPAAMYPPFRLGKLDEYTARLRRMLAKIGARFLITDSRIKRLLGPAAVGIGSLENVIDVKDLHSGAAWKRVDVDPDQPVFLQFSSGTTVEPKAVTVSHTNLVYNLAMMGQALIPKHEAEADQGAVCWLPLYHDMGLVGCLYLGLYYPGTVTYLGPEQFLIKPALWLQTLSKYRAVISPAPHFAYGLCVNKIKDEEMEGVDLSHWRAALNGAEPVDAEGINRFCDRFARWGFRRESMTPVYGLAEAGLGVSFTDLDSPPLIREFDRDALAVEGKAVPAPGRRIVSAGRPLPAITVSIRDEQDHELSEGNAGRILVKGPSITKGYFNDPELTAKVIQDGWLDTGDIGFLLDGFLYISGRAKDLIIIRGRNYAPQEFEDLLLDIEGVRTGCAVAVSTVVEALGEQLIVLAERDVRSKRPEPEVVSEIRTRLLAGLSLIPHHVELLAPGTLPRTSSGKLRRSEALRQFLAGELAPPGKVTALKLIGEVAKSQIAWTRFRLQKP